MDLGEDGAAWLGLGADVGLQRTVSFVITIISHAI